MKISTGQKVFVLGLILAFASPFIVGANPKLVTPSTLAKGYAVQVASTTKAITLLESTYSKCHIPATVGSPCALVGEQIKSLNTDLHILQVSYNLLNSSLEATSTL